MLEIVRGAVVSAGLPVREDRLTLLAAQISGCAGVDAIYQSHNGFRDGWEEQERDLARVRGWFQRRLELIGGSAPPGSRVALSTLAAERDLIDKCDALIAAARRQVFQQAREDNPFDKLRWRRFGNDVVRYLEEYAAPQRVKRGETGPAARFLFEMIPHITGEQPKSISAVGQQLKDLRNAP